MINDADLTSEFNFRVHELHDVIEQSKAVRSIDPELFPENYAVEERIRLLDELVRTSRAMSDLIGKSLEPTAADREMIETARELVNESKAEIERFRLIRKETEIEDMTDTIH